MEAVIEQGSPKTSCWQDLVPEGVVDVIIYAEDERALALSAEHLTKAKLPEGLRIRLVIARTYQPKEPADLGALEEGHIELVAGTPKEGGFARSIASAFAACTSPWVVVLSEHVRVFNGWLPLLFSAAREDTGMVAPLTSRFVPAIPGLSAREMARSVVGSVSLHASLISFPFETCLLLHRSAVEAAGGLCPEGYEPGGGEFLELYLRMHRRGMQARLCESCWVVDDAAERAPGPTWEPESRRCYARFISKHGEEALQIRSSIDEMDWRRKVTSELQVAPRKVRDVVFVFREVVVCGLVLAVAEICSRLNRTGSYNAIIACTRLDAPERGRLPLDHRPLVFESEVILRRYLSRLRGAIVVATLTTTAEDIQEASKLIEPRPALSFPCVPVYFLQDDERAFKHADGRPMQDEQAIVDGWRSIEARIVNSAWLKKELALQGLGSTRIGIGVDTLRFRPGCRDHVVPRIMAHCRPSTARRGWPFVQAVLNRVARSRQVDIVTYDEKPEGLESRNVSNLGRLSPWELAPRMGEADIFFEGSEQQGWGMQGLEAMASGCALVATNTMGLLEYGSPGQDCVVVPHGEVELAAAAICHLIDHPEERRQFGDAARETALQFDWSRIGKAWEELLSKL